MCPIELTTLKRTLFSAWTPFSFAAQIQLLCEHEISQCLVREAWWDERHMHTCTCKYRYTQLHISARTCSESCTVYTSDLRQGFVQKAPPVTSVHGLPLISHRTHTDACTQTHTFHPGSHWSQSQWQKKVLYSLFASQKEQWVKVNTFLVSSGTM